MGFTGFLILLWFVVSRFTAVIVSAASEANLPDKVTEFSENRVKEAEAGS